MKRVFSRVFLWAGIIAITIVAVFISRRGHDSLKLYNYLPASAPVSIEIDEMKQYISECAIVAEIDRVDITLNRSPNTETEVTRVFHVRRVIRGSIPANAKFYDNLYQEENSTVGGITTQSYQGTYWLLLKENCLLGAAGKMYIDRSEAYVYQYFVFGEDIQQMIESIP